MKSYCTQNNGNCETCSLVNYGLDCKNNPVSVKTGKSTRYTRMMEAYGGFTGPATVKAIMEQIPEDLQQQLTGKQLGLVMQAVNKAYHNGKAALGGISIEDDCVWFPWGGKEGKGQLVPVAALRNIKTETSKETHKIDANPIGGWSIRGDSETVTKTKYTMDYTESC